MPEFRLLGICGSLRAGSLNAHLLHEARIAFDPADYIRADLRLPLYDGDVEARGLPESVQTLANQIAWADAVVVAGPEYNKAISGVLKNALDWVSRVKTPVWKDKPLAIVSATAGRSGGERAQDSMRACLRPFLPRILPGPEVLIGGAAQAFDASGHLVDPKARSILAALMTALRAEVRRAR
jgi:chromate reductase